MKFKNTYYHLLDAFTRVYGREAAEYVMRDKSPEDVDPYWSIPQMEKEAKEFLSKGRPMAESTGSNPVQ